MSIGLSNVSFGLPNRRTLNAATLLLAIESGLTAAILDMTHKEIRHAVLAANLAHGAGRVLVHVDSELPQRGSRARAAGVAPGRQGGQASRSHRSRASGVVAPARSTRVGSGACQSRSGARGSGLGKGVGYRSEADAVAGFEEDGVGRRQSVAEVVFERLTGGVERVGVFQAGG